MGIILGSNFDVQTALPLDSRIVVADLTARDAINALQRYEGLLVYVVAEGTNFQLIDGILNANWEELSGGGGGGIDIEWFQNDYAPLETITNAASVSINISQVYEFEDATFHYLFAEIKVPNSYSAGNPISLYIQFFTSAITGTVLFQSTATLVRNGVDPDSSLINQRVSTNAAITVNGVANVQTTAILDLSSTIGEINAVAVNPGDRIKIALTRLTTGDTAAASAFLYKKGSEVSIA